MLRAVSYGWKQAALADKAAEVFRLGRELHERLGQMGNQFDKLGRALASSVNAYNETVGDRRGPGAGLGPPVPRPPGHRGTTSAPIQAARGAGATGPGRGARRAPAGPERRPELVRGPTPRRSWSDDDGRAGRPRPEASARGSRVGTWPSGTPTPTPGSWGASPSRSRPLFADLVEVPDGGRVLDVGCGPGVLTAELVERYGADRVDAIDPLRAFVDGSPGPAARRRRAAGQRGVAPLRRRHLRRRARPARRPLHERPGGRAGGDGARHPAGWASGRVRVGPRRRARPAVAASGRPSASLDPVRHERVVLAGRPGRATWPAAVRRGRARRRRGRRAVGDDRADVVRGLVGAVRGARRVGRRLPRDADAPTRSASSASAAAHSCPRARSS